MRIKFNQETSPDWAQRYSGCFGLVYRENRKPVLARFDEIEEDRVFFTDAEGHEQFVNINANVEFDFPVLEGKWWPTTDAPILTMRRPRRQWRRGICAENCTIYSFMQTSMLLAQNPSFETLLPIFYPPKKVGEGYINEYFSFSGDVLYFKEKIIGSINKARRILRVDELFHQEIVDAMIKEKVFPGYTLEKRDA